MRQKTLGERTLDMRRETGVWRRQRVLRLKSNVLPLSNVFRLLSEVLHLPLVRKEPP